MKHTRRLALLFVFPLLAACGNSPVAPIDLDPVGPVFEEVEEPCPPPAEGEPAPASCRGGYIGSGS
jgi:hypothetical protein